MKMKLQTGECFTAIAKSGEKYKYEFLYLNPLDNGKEIVLYNHDLYTETRVEAEWFRQRKIILELGYKGKTEGVQE